MMKKVVSITVPCYNVEETIEEVIKSVLNQSYAFFELILINDGSIDKTFEILKRYESEKGHKCRCCN